MKKQWQEGYDHLSSDVFRVLESENLGAWEGVRVSPNSQNLEKVKAKFQIGLPSINGYAIKVIPRHARRNQGDSAKLLLIYTDDGTFGKRFNNSQWFALDF